MSTELKPANGNSTVIPSTVATPESTAVIKPASLPENQIRCDLEKSLTGCYAIFDMDVMSTEWIENFDKGGDSRCKAVSECLVESDVPQGITYEAVRKWPLRKLNALALTIIEVMYGPKEAS